MIEFLRNVKDISEVETFIGEIGEDKIYLYPVIVLTPQAEQWRQDLLGNNKGKIIKFKMIVIQDYAETEYEELAEKGVELIKSTLKNKIVKSEIVSYLGVDISYKTNIEETEMHVIADVTLELKKRSEDNGD